LQASLFCRHAACQFVNLKSRRFNTFPKVYHTFA
jgi:hypothetical protein